MFSPRTNPNTNQNILVNKQISSNSILLHAQNNLIIQEIIQNLELVALLSIFLSLFHSYFPKHPLINKRKERKIKGKSEER